MKRLFIIVLLCTAIIFTSTSCTLLWSALEPTNHWVLCSVGINIPGILFDNNGYEYDTEVLEQDSYGRVLFAFRDRNHFYRDNDLSVTALAILQCYEDEFVYYYEDTFYQLVVSQTYQQLPYETYDQSMIDVLKEKNDWNQPLDQTKCITHTAQIGYFGNRLSSPLPGHYPHCDEIRFQFAVTKEIHMDNLDACIAGWDKADRFLYMVRAKSNTGESKHYFVIADKDYQNEIHICEIEDLYNHNDELAAFKASCQWGKEP